MLALAVTPFYNHGHTLAGFILVGVVCGTMTLISLYVAWKNFGPPARRRARTPVSRSGSNRP